MVDASILLGLFVTLLAENDWVLVGEFFLVRRRTMDACRSLFYLCLPAELSIRTDWYL